MNGLKKVKELMICNTPKNKFIKGLLTGIILLLVFFAMDYIYHYNHYNDYWELQHCRDTFGEKCKLEAIPASVHGLLDEHT